jgi:hypothetical protein
VKLIKKKIEDNHRRWHEVLSEALWAHRISRHGATKITPFELVYGQEAVLPVEVNLDAYRLAKQNNIDVESYYALMMDNVDKVTTSIWRLWKKLRMIKGELLRHTTRR